MITQNCWFIMNLFLSQFINKVDKKGRVSLPSSFRSALPKENKNKINTETTQIKHKINTKNKTRNKQTQTPKHDPRRSQPLCPQREGQTFSASCWEVPAEGGTHLQC